MTGNTLSDCMDHEEQTDQENQNPLVKTYRHDAHKLFGQSHDNASTTFRGVPVNQPVPYNADADASALSRPAGEPEITVETHTTHTRLSLVTGDTATRWTRPTIEPAACPLLVEDDPEKLHREWLGSDLPAQFNESPYYPYTSLKYHTLLVAALLDNYRAGHSFSDLHLIGDPADEVIRYRTVYTGEDCSLRIDGNPSEHKPSAQLGSRPWQSWASTWTRLPDHPLDTNHNKTDMVLDANLRRISSWSTALQYLEDYRREHTR